MVDDNMQKLDPRANSCTPWTRRRCALLLTLVVIVGFAVRGIFLSRAAVWYDEYWGISQIGARNLHAYLGNQSGNTFQMPLYFILQYYWGHYVAQSTEGVRWLSIIAGMLAAPLAYLIGRDLWSPGVGLFVALYVALSPYHALHSQEMRPYSFVDLFGLCSVLTFLKLMRRSAWWQWALNVGANVLLVYTHVFGGWLIATEGCFLLLFRRQEWRRVALWALAQAALIFPAFLMVLAWQNAEDHPLGDEFIGTLVGWFFMDTMRVAVVPRFDPTVHNNIQFGAAYLLSRCFLPCMFLLAGILAFSTGKHATRTLRQALAARAEGRRNDIRGSAPNKGESCREAKPKLEEAFFLLMWFMLPGLMQWGFAKLLYPANEMRFTMYSSVAAYLMLAGWIAAMKRPRWKHLLAGLVVTILAYNMGLAIFFPMRPDYLAATDFLKSHSSSDEKILFCRTQGKKAFDFNAQWGEERMTPVDSLPDLMEAVDAELELRPSVWAVIDVWLPMDGPALRTVLERYFDLRNIRYTRTGFLGAWDVFIYHCEQSPFYRPFSKRASLVAFQAGLDQSFPESLLNWDLGRAFETAGYPDEAIEAFRNAIKVIPKDPEDRQEFNRVLRDIFWNDPNEMFTPDYYAGRVIGALCGQLTALGREDQAFQEYLKGTASYPDNTDLAAGLAKLKARREGRDQASPPVLAPGA